MKKQFVSLLVLSLATSFFLLLWKRHCSIQIEYVKIKRTRYVKNCPTVQRQAE